MKNTKPLKFICASVLALSLLLLPLSAPTFAQQTTPPAPTATAEVDDDRGDAGLWGLLGLLGLLGLAGRRRHTVAETRTYAEPATRRSV
jgi:MYXO-CTERM domain-containing protein